MMAQESRNWVKEAQDCLHGRYINLLRLKAAELMPLVINPELDETEAQYFIRGLEGGLFSIDEEGYVQSKLLPDRPRKNTKQKILCLFWARKGKWGLFREGVCQLATVSSLILKYGWLGKHIRMEPTLVEFPDLAWGVDILIKDEERNVTICGEVKRNRSEFRRLVEGFRNCCRRGFNEKDQCNFKKHHPKYAFCYKLRPSYFFVTAPEEQICFKLIDSNIQEEHRGLVYYQAVDESAGTP